MTLRCCVGLPIHLVDTVPNSKEEGVKITQLKPLRDLCMRHISFSRTVYNDIECFSEVGYQIMPSNYTAVVWGQG